jgi:hypothetical protein
MDLLHVLPLGADESRVVYDSLWQRQRFSIGRTMPLTRNINSRGKVVRLIYGIILAAIGIALAVFWAFNGGGVVAWVISAACLASGAFAIFEARTGWCVVRAMGFKTPM